MKGKRILSAVLSAALLLQQWHMPGSIPAPRSPAKPSSMREGCMFHPDSSIFTGIRMGLYSALILERQNRHRD